MSIAAISALRAPRVTRNPIEMRLDQIGMSFSDISVLRGVNVSFAGGEIHTLMGENGAGKSTLVKIISGVQSPTNGSMFIDGKPVSFASPREAEDLGIVIMHQELSLIPDMTVAENVMLGHEPLKFGMKIDRAKLRETAKTALARFGFTLDINTRIRDLRVGEQQLVEIARALLMDARVLIMDEPTSALSQNETDILMEVVRDLAFQGVAVIYISHRMDEVFEISDRVTVLRDGNQIGSSLVADTTPADLVHMMVGRPVDIQPVDRQTAPTHEQLMEVRDLTVWANNREVLKDVSFKLNRGEVLGVGGLLGSGRTELVETLFGARGGSYEGQIEIDGKIVRPTTPKDGVTLGLALITEDRKGNGLILSDTIANNIVLPLMPLKSRFGIMSNKLRRDQSLSTIEQLRIAANGPDHIVGKLSGGNQQKVVLGKWLATDPRILLLDEPTRGIDIGAKDEIYDLVGKLADQGLSVIFTSSELSEFVAVCDRVIVLCEGQVAGELTGEDVTHEAIKDLILQAPAPNSSHTETLK